MYRTLVIVAVIALSSLAVSAIYIGFFRPSTKALTRSDEPRPRDAANPGERAANEATKWI